MTEQITKAKERSLKEIKASELKHRLIVENMPQNIFVKDKNFVYISCNKNFAENLNKKPDEIVGKTDFDFFPKELAKKYRLNDKKIMKEGKTLESEEEYTLGGKRKFVHTFKTPLRNKKGGIIGVICLFCDSSKKNWVEETLMEKELLIGTEISEMMRCINEIEKGNFNCKVNIVEDSGMENLVNGFNKMVLDLKELMASKVKQTKNLEERETALRKSLWKLGNAMEELKTIDRMKNRFLATTSHELKTPITPLIIQMQLLKRGKFGKMNEKQFKSIEMIYRNIKRLDKLIDRKSVV